MRAKRGAGACPGSGGVEVQGMVVYHPGLKRYGRQLGTMSGGGFNRPTSARGLAKVVLVVGEELYRQTAQGRALAGNLRLEVCLLFTDRKRPTKSLSDARAAAAWVSRFGGAPLWSRGCGGCTC